ncbi:PLP-dependent aminotransferase family protein [Acinetobacter ihumii]|uniref:aminotransferase-like domain-containing protein n=1 Tax=Acinetobacter ihumii TaxID=2483802 RepID=UPI001032556E|nr:PLP-dependent aminotransferase family protein [Acinetobacter ihumii]
MYKSKKLAQQLRQHIENGKWSLHSKLPSLREQAQNSGLSLMTVMNAYQELEAQGLIYSKEKSGYFVAQSASGQNSQASALLSHHTKIEINSVVFKYLKSIQTQDVIPFGSAFPDPELLSPAKLLQILSQMARHRKNYDQYSNLPPGNAALRQVIAQRYQIQGIAAHADDIVISSGGLDALNLSLQALTQPGDYILLQQNTFYGAWQAAERLGLKVITIAEHPQYGFDLNAFEHLLQQYPIKVCWFMLNAQNPVGFTVRFEIKAKIAELLHQYQVCLIEDDVYEELYYGANKPVPMKYFDQDNLILHCSSFSKTLGAGFRVGWVHAGKYSEHIQHLQLMSTISSHTLIQNALVEFVSSHHYEKHLRQIRRRLQKNKRLFADYLKQYLSCCCEIYDDANGYFLWIKLPIHINSFDLYQQLMMYQISVAPSSLFNLFDTKQHHIRINCSFEWSQTVEKALDIVVQCIQNFKAER